MNGLQGRVAFVTGAGRGIGAAIARRLVAEGVRVAVTDVDPDTAAATAESLGSAALGLQVDVTQPGSVAAGVAATEAGLGPIDILVNNAGWDRTMPFLDMPLDLWDQIIAINFRGPLHCCRAVLPGMIDRGYGRIVSIASDAGRAGSGGEAVYSGAKGGVIAFSKTLARENARKGVSVNVVCPAPPRPPSSTTSPPSTPTCARPSSAQSPCVASVSPTISPAPSPSSPPRTPPTSPARPSRSAAASR